MIIYVSDDVVVLCADSCRVGDEDAIEEEGGEAERQGAREAHDARQVLARKVRSALEAESRSR